MSEALRKTNDSVVTDTYAQKTAMRLGVSIDAVRSEFKKASPSAPAYSDEEPESPADEPESAPIAKPSATEEWLVRLLLENDEWVEWIDAHLDLDWVTHPAARFVIASRLDGFRSQTWPGLATWVSTLEDPAMRNLVAGIIADSRPCPAPQEVLCGSPGKKGIVQRLRDEHLDHRAAEVRQQLARADLSPDEYMKDSALLLALREAKRQPLTPRNESGDSLSGA
jgi:hypothetical protein